jgi:hypothetical protein
MKYLTLVVVFVGLFTSKLYAQGYRANVIREAKGQLISVADSVKKIRVINSSRVYMTLGLGVPDSCVTVILQGKGAYKLAESLKPYIVDAKGYIELINGKPFMTVTDFRRITVFNCNCQAGDPDIDHYTPGTLTVGQQDTLNNILLNRNKANAPGLPIKDVNKYLGHKVYVRDSIISGHQYSKSFTELSIGEKSSNQVLTVLLLTESVNQKALWKKLGIAQFYGEVTMYDNKPAILISDDDQMSIEAQK